MSQLATAGARFVASTCMQVSNIKCNDVIIWRRGGQRARVLMAFVIRRGLNPTGVLTSVSS